MKDLLLLLALAGFASCLQPGLHYRYQYLGHVTTGMPDLSHTSAGWAMKAEVNVFVEKDTEEAVFKLEDFRMAYYNDDLGCDLRGEIPDELFKPSEDTSLNAAVEEPFIAHLFHYEDFAIEHHEDKFKWLTNMRKGIASILKNEILKGNYGNQVEGSVSAVLHEGKVLNIFSVHEDTMFGHCKVDYSFYPIPEYLAGKRNHHLEETMEEDVQRPGITSAPITKGPTKTSKKSRPKSTKKVPTKSSRPSKYIRPDTPPLTDDLWHVVRTVDFDHCHEKVAVQMTTHGFHDDVSGNQKTWTRGRSSVAEYIFRGSPGKARLERAVVEGATFMEPLGIKTHHMEAIVNQTLQLVSVKSSSKAPIVPEPHEFSKTWMYEIFSFAETPKESKVHPWIVYTGEKSKALGLESIGSDPSSKEDIHRIKNGIITLVKSVSEQLTDMEQEVPMYEGTNSPMSLELASTLFQALSKEDILEVFDHFFAKDLLHSDSLAKKLIIDTAVASGSHFAIDAILDFIEQKKIPDVQIMTVFMTLSNNAACHATIPHLMDYALSLNLKDKPFLTATVLINLAELINQMCIDPQARDIRSPGAFFGDNGCDKDLVKNKFLPHLKDIIHNHESSWEKDVAINALKMLGTPYSFPILAPVVEGTVSCDDRVRVSAIIALEAWDMMPFQQALRRQVIDLLSDVYSDIGEPTEVREAALETIPSWQPDTNFWHRLARTSWREPSRNFATFMTAMIETYASLTDTEFLKQTQAASQALKFARPITPSERYSYIQLRQSALLKKHFLKFDVFSWRASEDSYHQLKEVSYFMMTSLGGVELSPVELYLYTDGVFSSLRKFLQERQEEGGAQGIAARIAQDFYDRIQDTIKAQKYDTHATPKAEITLRLFDNLHLFLPINQETISSLPIHDQTTAAAFLVQLGMGYDLVLGKFFKPINLKSIHPTELGLPLSASTTTSILISKLSYTSLAVGGSSDYQQMLNKIEVSSEILFKLSTFQHSVLSALLPWGPKAVLVGHQSRKDVTFPLDVVVKRHEKNQDGHQSITRIDINSHFDKKFVVFQAESVPYSAIAILFEGDLTKFNAEPLVHSPPNSEKIHVPNKYSGLELDVTWKSEMAFPFSNWNIFNFLRNPEAISGTPWLLYALASPTPKYYSFTLTLDPAAAKTKNVSIEFMKGYFGKSTGDLGQETQTSGNDFSQYGQEGGYEQYDQQEFQESQGFQEFDPDAEVEVAHISSGDSLAKRAKILQDQLAIQGSIIYTKSLKVDFHGDEHRTYELLLSYSSSKSDSDKKYKKAQVSLLRGPIPHYDENPSSLCLDIQKTYPAFSKLDTVESLLAMDLDRELKAELLLNCKGEPVAKLHGKNHVSEEGKKILQEEATKWCDFDPFNPLYSVRNHALYDENDYTLSWEEFCDAEHFPITDAMFNAVDKVLVLTNLHKRCDRDDDRELEVKIHRNLRSGDWDVDLSRANHEFHLNHVPSCDMFEHFFSVDMHSDNLEPDFHYLFNQESQTCVVDLHNVRTFDGFVYDFEMTPCWQVVAKDCSVDNGRMVLMRSPRGEADEPEVKYIDVSKGLVVEYTGHRVRVNGKIVDPVSESETINDDEGHFLVKVFKKNDFYMVKLAQGFYISAKDKVRIYLPAEMKGSTCGMCGNFDGEPEGELIGPHRCMYEDPKTFGASWTAGGDTCDLYTLLELREDAEKFQKKCHSYDSVKHSCVEFNHRCFKYAWVVKAVEGDKACVSASPIPYCDESCASYESYLEEVKLNCWPKDKAPSVIKEALAAGQTYTTSPITAEPYYHEDYVNLRFPVACKQPTVFKSNLY